LHTHDELMATLREHPEDEATWAVLQDWLLAHDDPRGKLAAAPKREFPRLLEQLAAQWFGRPVEVEKNSVWIREHLAGPDTPCVRLDFVRGHVHKLTFLSHREGWGQRWVGPLLARILSQPVGQLVFEMEIRAAPNMELHYAGLVEAITAQGPLAVRELYCGDDDQLSWTHVPDCASLWAAAPYLEKVILEGSSIHLGELHHERLRHLELISGGLPREPVEALVRARLPALQHLDVWFGDSGYDAECSIDDAQGLLDRDFASVRHMGLRNCEFSDELVPRLLQARWLPQLESLSLADSVLRDAGGRALLAGAASLRHLQRLDLEDCYLSDALYAELDQALGGILTGEQREAEDELYYVGVGE
jgi:hypothetical protein